MLVPADINKKPPRQQMVASDSDANSAVSRSLCLVLPLTRECQLPQVDTVGLPVAPRGLMVVSVSEFQQDSPFVHDEGDKEI
jgi:hypothetical protein